MPKLAQEEEKGKLERELERKKERKRKLEIRKLGESLGARRLDR